MKNLLKEKLRKGQLAIGTFVGIPHSEVTERLSRCGFDFLIIDSEHSPPSIETMQQMMQAMNGTDCTPIIRPQWNDMVIIKRVLDIGAHGVLIPWVNTKEEAEYAVRACMYPPEGVRGCAPRRHLIFDPDYIETANDEVLVIVQIETRKAVSNIDDILSVKGVDACYIGPLDLSLSFGFHGPQWDNPEYLGAFDKVLAAAKKWGKPAGMATNIGAGKGNVRWAIEKGFTLPTAAYASAFLMEGARRALELARGSQ